MFLKIVSSRDKDENINSLSSFFDQATFVVVLRNPSPSRLIPGEVLAPPFFGPLSLVRGVESDIASSSACSDKTGTRLVSL